MLDAGPQRLRKRDRVGDMPAVAGQPRSDQFAFGYRRSSPRTARDPQTPRLVHVIFRPCTDDLRVLGAVHIKQVVTFAEPPYLCLDHVQNGSDVVPSALNL